MNKEEAISIIKNLIDKGNVKSISAENNHNKKSQRLISRTLTIDISFE
ncbi:hypothetical protein ACT5YR_07680 [Fructobacillus fructosus]